MSGGRATRRAYAFLARRRIPEASGENPQGELLLRHLNLRKVILSGDAAYCQHSLANHVNAQGGDCVLNLKGNQPEAKDEIHPLLETLAASRPPDPEQTEKGHGRLETRRCRVTGDVDSLDCRGQWSGLTSIALCERETLNLVTGKVSIGRRFFGTSHAPDAPRIARSGRQHWQVEPERSAAQTAAGKTTFIGGSTSASARTSNAAAPATPPPTSPSCAK